MGKGRRAYSPLIQLFFGFASESNIYRDNRYGNWLSLEKVMLDLTSSILIVCFKITLYIRVEYVQQCVEHIYLAPDIFFILFPLRDITLISGQPLSDEQTSSADFIRRRQDKTKQ